MIKKSGTVKKAITNAAVGISLEILYVLALSAAAFLVCFIIIR
jgi:hypothetical protein